MSTKPSTAIVRHPLVELTRARLLEFLRDPGAFFWVFVFPMLLAVALGIAFREGPQTMPGCQTICPPGVSPVGSDPSVRYIDFLIPGLIGLNVMGSCMWGMGYNLVDSRRRKLLKRFAVTPMNRTHYLLSHMVARLVFLVLEVAALLLFGMLVFGLEIRGSVPAVSVVALLGTVAFSGPALLVASRTESTEVASGWMNFVQLPMWVLSGSFFDYQRFPEVVHPLVRLLPLTAMNDSLRGLVNHGDPLWAHGSALLVMAAWGIGGFLLALRIFKWQ